MSFFLIVLLACFPEIREGEERRFVDNPSVDNDGDNFTEEDGDCNDRDDEIAMDSLMTILQTLELGTKMPMEMALEMRALS